ncbi:MAG TPA: glycosyltransferase [Candidatus Kapabacteria bacterium]|nr:glycosyltransferase [Candidatus Kapabacteria bacterium]
MNQRRIYSRRTRGNPSSPLVQITLPDRPLLSVIIPTKNEEKLLERCLQQFSGPIKSRFGIELIVSDGGSSDNTIGIAAAYADFIATHEAPWRQTIAEGRNRGAELAHANLLIFLNADTMIADVGMFLDRVIQRFAVDESIAALATRVEVMPEERRWSDFFFHAYFNQYVRAANVIGLGMGRGECQIVRRKAFEALNGYNPRMAAGEDFDLFRRLRAMGSVKFDSKLLVYESPRRYRKYGYARVYLDWIRNGFAVLVRNRSANQVWEEVR